jgi:glycosyltransferase involved in cell wall biosynthesis
LETSRYFDGSWYAGQYPIAGNGTYRSPLEHYLRNDTPTAFDPNPDFSEAWYLSRDPGLAAAVESRAFRNGYAHFLRYGCVELRTPAPHIDLEWYAAVESVRDSILEGVAADAFSHWLCIGKPAGLSARPPAAEQIERGRAQALYRRKAMALLPGIGRAPLRFACAGDPVISVVMAVRGDLAMTLATLSSLRANTPEDVELILIVLGNSDIGRFVTGAIVQRLDETVGEEAAIVVGVAYARADATIVLTKGVEIGAGSIDALSRRIHSDARIVAVGGKVLDADGLLISAGHIVWRDGQTQAYLRGMSPLAPEANFARDVHFCGSALLAMRTSVLRASVDNGVPPPATDSAAAALCLGAIAAQSRVVYDPAAMVTVWRDPDPDDTLAIDTELHVSFLSTCHDADGRMIPQARYADTARRRILYIDDTVPLRAIGSGFVRGNDLVATMTGVGFAVTVFPVNGCRFGLTSIYADMPDTAEIMHDWNVSRLAEFLRARRGVYDTIWIARTHNLDRIRSILDEVFADDPAPPAIVLDTEALVSEREAALARLGGRGFDVGAALHQELSNAGICRTVVTVSDAEAAILRAAGCGDVHVLGHLRPLNPSPRSFDQRAGMLFVGAIHRMDSPNYDGLCWFVDEVLPIVEQNLRWETRLTIAGYTAPGVTLERFAHHPRITLRGAVSDLASLYSSHRLFVAPTRFAAGAPYKIHEAASFGLPVVASALLRYQLDWTDGEDLLTAEPSDPAAFAGHIVALYRDADLWRRLREGALARLARENGRDAYVEALLGILGRPHDDT